MNSNNPLQKYFRQPKIYMKLPTGGKFNPELETTILDEIAVCSMSAIDEISLKNPEALLNGEAMNSVIKSCVPSIKDPMKLCHIDVEALFLAIQYATYNDNITHEHKCSNCSEVTEYKINVDDMLNRFPDIDFIDPILFEDINIHVRPPTLENISRMALIELEQQRIIRNFQDTDRDFKQDENSDLLVAQRFYKSFKKIATFNVDMLANTVGKIETPNGVITDQDYIVEFLQNVPASLVNKLNKAVEKIMKKPEDVNKMSFVCENCKQEDTIYMEMNPVNFSEAGS
jgi:hypothetical protein